MISGNNDIRFHTWLSRYISYCIFRDIISCDVENDDDDDTDDNDDDDDIEPCGGFSGDNKSPT